MKYNSCNVIKYVVVPNKFLNGIFLNIRQNSKLNKKKKELNVSYIFNFILDVELIHVNIFSYVLSLDTPYIMHKYYYICN